LLSNWRTAEAAVSAKPLLEEGVVSQDWTAEVTSMVTNSPEAGTFTEPREEPMAGRVFQVTLYSPQAALMGATESVPGVVARLQ
jgi:hypothetical protein